MLSHDFFVLCILVDMGIMDALIAMDALNAMNTLIANLDACLLNICSC